MFAPKRISPYGSVDKQFALELASVFDLCGLGLLQVKEVVRMESMEGEGVREEFGIWTRKYFGLDGEEKKLDLTFTLVVLVWPTREWNALRAGLANMTCDANLTNVAVCVVPDDLVLMNAKRKSRLISTSLGIFSIVTRGKGIIVLPDTREETSAPLANRVHVAITCSNDFRWMTFAWCDPRGIDLCSRALFVKGDLIQTNVRARRAAVLRVLDIVSSEMRAEEIVVIFSSAVEEFSASSLHLFSQDEDFEFNNEQLPKLLVLTCNAACVDGLETAPPPSPYTSLISENAQETARKELDDLAFLTTVTENPARGALYSIGGALGDYALGPMEDNEPLYLPLHLRAAKLLAMHLDGVSCTSAFAQEQQ